MAGTKTILVTGCSAGGIGAALVAALAAQGPSKTHVFATARDTNKIPASISSLPNVTVLSLDVTSDSSVAEAARIVTAATSENKELGKGLDVLVNNAAVGYSMPMLDLDIEKAKQAHDTNVWGPVRMVQAFADLLIERKGRVVNMTTIGTAVNTPWIGAYASSKVALNMISDTLRLELAPFGVSVVLIVVGTVMSKFHDNEPEVILPPKSRYHAIRDIISSLATGKTGWKGESADDFVRSIVPDVIGKGSGTPHVWKGPNSAMTKFASRWMPTSTLDGMIMSKHGFDELEKSLKK